MVDGGSFRETTSVSWFGRLKRSVGGVVFGLILIIAMVMLLFWNEGRAVTTARSLEEGAGIVVSVAADAIDSANEGRLVHVSGPLDTTHVATDDEFGIGSRGVRLSRKAEMYQWIESSKSETRTKIGGGEETVTTYSYSTGWSDRAVNSSEFRQPDGRSNPPMVYQSKKFQVPDATLGAFVVDASVLDRVGGDAPISVSADTLRQVQRSVGTWIRASIADGRIYLGPNPSTPRVGDYRISYELAPLGDVSVVARQVGNAFEPYQTVAGNRLLMVRDGVVPADVIFADALTGNTMLTWVVRVAGLVFLAVGFSLIMAPLGVIGDIIPFIGSIIRMGTGIIAAFAAALIGSATIALAWFWYRPFLSLVILAIGAAVAAGVVYYGRVKKPTGPPADTAPAT